MKIQTERLHIRDLIESDWLAMHLLRTDPLVYRFHHFGPESEDDTQSWVLATMAENAKQPRSSHNCSIVLRNSDEVIGWIGFGEPSEGKRSWAECDFGYAIRPTFWNQGYTTEALRGMLRFIFEELNADSIFGECNVLNPASARVMEKAEMKLVAEYDADGDRVYRYAITWDEWRQQIASDHHLL